MSRHHDDSRCERRLRRLWDMHADRGGSPVELAIVAPVLLLLGFTVVQAALTFWANQIALAAATQGVNVERGYQASPGSGGAHAREFLAGAGEGLNNQQVTVSRTGRQVTVTVTGNAISLLPGVTFDISRTAHGSVERVTTP